MSLRVASSIATSALRTSEVGIAVASSNVANAGTDGYTRKTASNVTRDTGTTVSSVDVTSVSSNVDRYLLKTLVGAQSDLGYAETRSTYLDQMQSAFGSVSGDDSTGTDIGSMIDALADTLGTLATSPESGSAKAATVQDLSDLAETLRTTSSTIQSLRNQADDEIATTVDTINETLNGIDDLNDRIVKGKALGQNVTDLEDQRNTALKSLAENIDVTYQVDDSGLMRISTASGKSLLDSSVHELSYTPAASVSADTVYSSTGTSGFNGIMLNGVDVTGSSLGGSLGALVQLRDTDLPAQQAGLDELATSLIDTLNTIQNQGTSYPAPQTLTGTETVSASDALKVTSGTLRVAVTDSSGTAAEVLDIDLSTMSTLQDVVDAINTMSSASASISADGKLVISADSTGNGIALGGDANDGTTGSFSDALWPERPADRHRRIRHRRRVPHLGGQQPARHRRPVLDQRADRRRHRADQRRGLDRQRAVRGLLDQPQLRCRRWPQRAQHHLRRLCRRRDPGGRHALRHGGQHAGKPGNLHQQPGNDLLVPERRQRRRGDRCDLHPAIRLRGRSRGHEGVAGDVRHGARHGSVKETAMERVATYNHQNTLVQYMMKAEAQVAAEQVRSASGLNSTDYKGIATDSSRLVNLESHYRRLEQYIDEGEVVNGRIQSMYDAVGSMTDLTSRLSSLITGLQGDNAAGVEGVVAEAGQLMEELAGLMNTQQDGRYLFAGGRTDQTAVDLDSYTAATYPSSADTGYYQGDSTVAHFQAADDFVLSYGVTADDPAFEKALRAFSLIANMSTDPVDDDLLAEATELASDATDGLTITQAKLGAASSSLENTIDRHVDEQLVLQTQVDDIRSVDLAESTTKLSQLQASLEATMSLMKILEENNLSKYL